jgi:putative endonuclease
MWYVYVLINKKQDYKYLGITQDLERRLRRHNARGTRSTKPYRPFDRIVEIDCAETRTKARELGKFYKSGFGREKVNKMLKSLKEDSVGV